MIAWHSKIRNERIELGAPTVNRMRTTVTQSRNIPVSPPIPTDPFVPCNNPTHDDCADRCFVLLRGF